VSDLHPDTQSLLDAARDAHDPSAADRARIRAKVAARVGAGAFATTAAVAGASGTARGALKAGIAAVVGGAILVGGLWWKSAHEPQPAPPIQTAPVVAAPAPTPTPVVDPGLEPATVPVESLAPVIEKRVAQPAPVATDTQPRQEGQSTLEAELALLRDAKKALDDGDSSRALGILDEHQRRFPNGILVEERASTRVLALCAAGRTAEARASAQDFLAKYPRSPSAPRVRASCGAPQP
jgi:hypothetical protein